MAKLRASWKTIVPAPNVGYAALVANDDDFSSTFDGQSVFTASRSGAACAGLGEDNLADSVTVANCVANVSQHTGHLCLFTGKNSLVGKQHFEEGGP